MAQDKKPGTGAIFKNERKESENHPDYRGIIISPVGEEMQVALWLKTSQSGKKYFSVAASAPYKESDMVGAAAALAGAGTATPAPAPVADDDDLPF